MQNTNTLVKQAVENNMGKTRTVYDFPNVHSVQRQTCQGGFFKPNFENIMSQRQKLEHYFSLETVGLILPLASEREWSTFPQTLNYARKLGLTPERTIIVHSPKAQTLVDSLDLKEKGYVVLNEGKLIQLFNVERIHSRFAVDIEKYKGKGRAFMMAFAYLNYVHSWQTLKDLFFLDVDANVNEYQPLHYLGYSQVTEPDDNRFCLLTAQNNALRDNHYLFVMREHWRYESDLGRHYAAHLDQIVWSLTGEMMLRWDMLAEQIPFTIAYGIETIWQLFAADKVASSCSETQYNVAQVANPKTKQDGGDTGQSGRCYDATMYRQLNLMAWFLIKHGKPLCELRAEDYQMINQQLTQARHTAILPDNNDHNPPYRVELQSDLFIPPLAMLEAEDCLCL